MKLKRILLLFALCSVMLVVLTSCLLGIVTPQKTVTVFNPTLEPCHIHVRNHGALAKYWVGGVIKR